MTGVIQENSVRSTSSAVLRLQERLARVGTRQIMTTSRPPAPTSLQRRPGASSAKDGAFIRLHLTKRKATLPDFVSMMLYAHRWGVRSCVKWT